MEAFDVKEFVETTLAETKKIIGSEKTLVAVSGGVDSTTCAVLTHRAIGENLTCVILDDAFMRQDEPEHVAQALSKPPFNVPTKIVDVRERFLNAMKGLRDAEEKRKMFRETFYQTLAETAKKEKCKTLVQGTIRADIIETVGGVKTQHNVLEQIGINPLQKYGFKIVEPLLPLFKEQVRTVARYLKLPPEFSERQPFPGPGLSIRVVGEIHHDKLETLKTATTIAEKYLKPLNPGQYFATIMDNQEDAQPARKLRVQETTARFLNVPSRNVNIKIFKDKATGVETGKRRYGEVIGITVKTMNGKLHQTPLQNIIALQARIITENPETARIFYAIQDAPNTKKYIMSVRSVETKNFLEAKVTEAPWPTLEKIAQEISEKCPDVSTVYYDVTPKPPATIEME
jgi:GMP synthase (glutamine-hydrolysing)